MEMLLQIGDIFLSLNLLEFIQKLNYAKQKSEQGQNC